MRFGILLLHLFAIHNHFDAVYNLEAVCTKLEWERKSKRVNRNVPYYHTRKVTCRLFFTCTKGEWRDNYVQRIEYYEESHIIRYCCPGYKEIQKTCVPVCLTDCVNGECTAPNTCTCKTGYSKSIMDPYKCEPICNIPCIEGTCVSPNVCECRTGFAPFLNRTHVCLPVCEPQCTNGKCIAPNKCKCNIMYELANNINNHCQPICTPKCVNSDCIKPNICHCRKGYLQINHTHICEPHCSHKCSHGTCIDYEKCQCDIGYVKDKLNPFNCIPECSPLCINSFCLEPNICTCFSGYEKQNYSYCAPICTEPCFNGYCFKPNHCRCNSGYEPNEIDICNPVCIPSCINGVCIGPEKCNCSIGFEPTNEWNRCEQINNCANCTNSDCDCEEKSTISDLQTVEMNNDTDPALQTMKKPIKIYWNKISIFTNFFVIVILVALLIFHKKMFSHFFKRKVPSTIPDEPIVVYSENRN